jgi:hypothetical protein
MLQRCLAEALTEFVAAGGRRVDYRRRSSRREARPDFFHKAACFASSSRYEVVAEGRKVVASAACQRGTAVLQHGSIKLAGVAGHPALHFPDSPESFAEAELEPLGGARWAWACGLFPEVVGRRLGVKLKRVELDQAQTELLGWRSERVRKAASERRFF